MYKSIQYIILKSEYVSNPKLLGLLGKSDELHCEIGKLSVGAKQPHTRWPQLYLAHNLCSDKIAKICI